MRLDTTTRDLRHTYPQAERVRLAEDLSREMLLLYQAETEFEKLKAAHTAKTKTTESTIRDLARKLCEGWEYRDVPVRQLWNDPEIGKKTIVRLDTGEVVAIEDMTHDDRQESFGFVETASVPKPTLETWLESVAQQVNSGALDTPETKCTAEVGEILKGLMS